MVESLESGGQAGQLGDEVVRDMDLDIGEIVGRGSGEMVGERFIQEGGGDSPEIW